MTPLISVVIPTHNRAKLLADAIGSVRTATDDVEIVVVDDGSNDNTAAVCASIPGIIYLRHEQPLGPSAARNAGVQLSNGAFVNFLDDDDLLLPGALERLRNVLVSNPAAALCYGQIYVGSDEHGETLEKFPPKLHGGDIFWELLESNFIMIHSALIRRECIEQVGFFDVALWHNEDWDLWVRLAERWPIAVLDEPVGVVRFASPDQLSRRRKVMHRTALKLWDRWFNLPRARSLPERRRKLHRHLRNRSADHLMNEAVDQLKLGHLLKFAEYGFEALKIYVPTAARCFAGRSLHLFNQKPKPADSRTVRSWHANK